MFCTDEKGERLMLGNEIGTWNVRPGQGHLWWA